MNITYDKIQLRQFDEQIGCRNDIARASIDILSDNDDNKYLYFNLEHMAKNHTIWHNELYLPLTTMGHIKVFISLKTDNLQK